jgi:murein DD-endopeptidase MepM/ murein hydrolase activator NlpD
MNIGNSMRGLYHTLSDKYHDLFINFDKSKPNHYSKSFYYKLYINSYRIGEYTLEFADNLSRLMNDFWFLTLYELYTGLSRRIRKALEYKKSSFGRGEFSITRSLIDLSGNIAHIFSETARDFKKSPLYGLHSFGRLTSSSIKNFWTNYKKFFNYAAPICGLIVLLLTVSFWSHNKFALMVTFNGKNLGYIQTEQVFRAAVTNIEQSVKNDSGSSFALVYKPSFNLTIANTTSLEDSAKLSSNIIKLSSDQLIQGYGLYVDNNLVGVNKDEASIKSTLDKILSTYRKNTPGEDIDFVQNVEVKKGTFPNGNVKSIDQINKIITANVQQQQMYTVVAGDSPSGIATKLNIPLSKLNYLNPAFSSNPVKTGQQIVTEATHSFLSVKVIESETFTQAIPFSIKNVSNNQIYQNQTQISVNGVNGQASVNAEVTYVDGVAVDKKVISQTVVKAPIDQVVFIGTKPKPTTVASGIFSWPISAGTGYISCPFGGYSGHSGMDIACDQGTPIHAADAGTVEFSGYQGGYGFCVYINHGNGFVTLYGHTSKLLVTAGQKVFKGQVIALVGHTGHVVGRTGNHCHFEVQLNGTPVNPARYLGPR